MQLIPTILCGGAGSRLWPVSRELHPKPFLRLANQQSLLQMAFLRAAQLPGVEEIMTVTHCELQFKIEEEYRAVNQKKLQTSFILEPFARNTAPAIAAAVLYFHQLHKENKGDQDQDQETLLLILGADHLIPDQDAFQQTISEGIPKALKGDIVTFGIRPRSAHTGYGYIEAEKDRVLRFVEKPALETAKTYVESGRFLWNLGMFLFSVDSMLKNMQRYCPDILSKVKRCLSSSPRLDAGLKFHRTAVAPNGIEEADFIRREFASAYRESEVGRKGLALDRKSYAEVPEDSIDYAVMEKSEQIAVVASEMPWEDVGSWAAIEALLPADENGNRIEGEALTHEVSDCYIQSAERLVGALGLKNVMIIDTPDALLVANKAYSQDVKQLYSQLKNQNHKTHKLHRTVFRPWGTYTVLEESSRFKIKRIEVNPGESLSLQMHHHRSEHWIVVSGTAKVINGEAQLLIRTNESTYIPAGNKHRLSNPGVVPLIIIEVQSGEYLEEDDIIRFEDHYGRT